MEGVAPACACAADASGPCSTSTSSTSPVSPTSAVLLSKGLAVLTRPDVAMDCDKPTKKSARKPKAEKAPTASRRKGLARPPDAQDSKPQGREDGNCREGPGPDSSRDEVGIHSGDGPGRLAGGTRAEVHRPPLGMSRNVTD